MTDPDDPAALAEALDRAREATRAFGAETARTLAGATDSYRRASTGGRDLGASLARAFEDVAVRGRSLSDTLRRLALDLSRLMLNDMLKSIAGAGGGPLATSPGALFASADGNVIAGGRVTPFARGGVLRSPMLFPLADGVGLAGEAGPEAIMPLRRGSDGRLGVAAQGAAPVTIHFNVSATDAASFRRSETQIAAMLQRLASRGARNL